MINSKFALRISEVVQSSGVGRTKIYEAIRSGGLRAVKNGRTTLILADDIDRWLKSLPEHKPSPGGRQ